MRTARPLCRRIFGEELLSGHLDGMLGERDRRRVEQHLDACAICRRIYQELSELRDAIHAASLSPLQDSGVTAGWGRSVCGTPGGRPDLLAGSMGSLVAGPLVGVRLRGSGPRVVVPVLPAWRRWRESR